MSYKVLCLLFCLPISLIGQEFSLIENVSSETVPYANISFYWDDVNVGGTYSNANGLVHMNEQDQVDSIWISSIGYEAIGVRVSELSDTVTLKQDLYELEEVSVTSGAVASTLYWGYNKGKDVQSHTAREGTQIVVFINNELSKSVQAKSFHMLCKQGRTSNDAMFKVVFFENNNGVPGKQLPNVKIVSMDQVKGKSIDIPMDSIGLWIPPRGLFAGIEWMGCVSDNSDAEKLHKEDDCHLSIAMNYIKNEKIERAVFERYLFQKTGWFDINSRMQVSLSLIPVFGVSVVE